MGLIEISRSLFKELKIPSFISQFYVLGFVVNFWVSFGYIWEEIVFLKGLLKLGKIRKNRNVEDLM